MKSHTSKPTWLFRFLEVQWLLRATIPLLSIRHCSVTPRGPPSPTSNTIFPSIGTSIEHFYVRFLEIHLVMNPQVGFRLVTTSLVSLLSQLFSLWFLFAETHHVSPAGQGQRWIRAAQSLCSGLLVQGGPCSNQISYNNKSELIFNIEYINKINNTYANSGQTSVLSIKPWKKITELDGCYFFFLLLSLLILLLSDLFIVDLWHRAESSYIPRHVSVRILCMWWIKILKYIKRTIIYIPFLWVLHSFSLVLVLMHLLYIIHPQINWAISSICDYYKGCLFNFLLHLSADSTHSAFTTS